MKISRSDAVAVCIGIGHAGAKKFDKKRIVKKLIELSVEEEFSDIEVAEQFVEDEEERDRLNKLIEKIRAAEGKIDVVKDNEIEEEEDVLEDEEPEDEEDEDEEDEEEPEEPEDEEDEDEEDEEEPEEPEDEEDEVVPVRKKKSAKKTTKKKAAPKKTTKKKAAPKKNEIARDEFGNKEGTQAADINAVIIKSKKGVTAKQIVEKTGLKAARIHAHLLFLRERNLIVKDDDGKVTKA